MDGGDIAGIIAVTCAGLAVLVPIVGLTARFALRPIVEALVTLRDSGRSQETVHFLERRVALLEQEVHQMDGLRTQVERLAEDRDFHRQLAAPRPDETVAPR